MQSITKKSRLLETYAMIIIDILCVIISYVISISIRFGVSAGYYSEQHFTVAVCIIVVSLLYSIMLEWNRGFFIRGTFVEFIAVLKYTIVLLVAMSCFVFITKADYFSRLVFGYFGIINLVLTWVVHLTFKKYMMDIYRNSINADQVMIVTTRKYVEKIMERVMGEKSWNYNISCIAIFDEEVQPDAKEVIHGVPVVAGGSNLLDEIRKRPLDEVFLSLHGVDIGIVKELIENIEIMGITCNYNVDIPELNLVGKTAGKFAGYPVMSFSLQYLDFRKMMIKRIGDIIGSIVGLLVTALIFPFVALAIKLESKGPVLFSQIRVGKNGRRFKIYKFRSMYLDAEARKAELMSQNEVKGLMFKMEDDPRVTKVGKFIRKYSIDELPQFYNILKGDMSLVGTRPPTIDEFERYNNSYRRRLAITPGLTGMWQVSGRSMIDDFDKVVELDVQYIENWSIWLDIKIILQTVGVVLLKKGAK